MCKAVDELNKNHNELDRESYTAIMPEMVSDPKCPLSSFEVYFEYLNPNCDSLWQRPREKMNLKLNDQVWYYDKCVGIDTLHGFMKKLSQKYSLSQVYTNRCVRVTDATILQRKKYAQSQIQTVTGHKSISSLAIYQRISKEEKMEMGKSLGENLAQRSQIKPLNTVCVAELATIGVSHTVSSPPPHTVTESAAWVPPHGHLRLHAVLENRRSGFHLTLRLHLVLDRQHGFHLALSYTSSWIGTLDSVSH